MNTLDTISIAPRPKIGALDGDVIELSVLLPRWQAARLEAAAHDRGLTTAQMLRILIRDCLSGSGSSLPLLG